MASFNDIRCETGGVCSSDPLFFTCELKEVPTLRVILPNDGQEVISKGDMTTGVVLDYAGVEAVSLNITEVGFSKLNIRITLSIANASLLNGGKITCDDTNRNATVVSMAGCPLLGKSPPKNEDTVDFWCVLKIFLNFKVIIIIGIVENKMTSLKTGLHLLTRDISTPHCVTTLLQQVFPTSIPISHIGTNCFNNVIMFIIVGMLMVNVYIFFNMQRRVNLAN